MEPPDVLKKVCASEDTSENWNNFFSVQVVVVSERQAQESGSFDSNSIYLQILLFSHWLLSGLPMHSPTRTSFLSSGHYNQRWIQNVSHILTNMRDDYCCVTFDHFRGKRHLLAKIVASLNQTNISKFNQVTLA